MLKKGAKDEDLNESPKKIKPKDHGISCIQFSEMHHFSMETREGKVYTNEEGAESPKAFAGKGGAMYSIEKRKNTEDVKVNETEPELSKNIDIKWNYLEDDNQIQPPAVLGLPDLQSEDHNLNLSNRV